jgi:hypothetical protein
MPNGNEKAKAPLVAMTPAEVRIDGPAAGTAPATVILAHGAGAGMDTPFLTGFAHRLAAAGYRVIRFEFPYMAARREGGSRRPPDRTDTLVATWRQVIDCHRDSAPLVIGGKSLGGRMASLIADEVAAAGLVCLGYPFHPPDRPERPRVAHLADIRTPTLILQGTRDPFGSPDDVAGYRLSPAIRLVWIADGDHGFRPRTSSGRSERQAWEEALAILVAWLATVSTTTPISG